MQRAADDRGQRTEFGISDFGMFDDLYDFYDFYDLNDQPRSKLCLRLNCESSDNEG